jgi:hypothetical protein
MLYISYIPCFEKSMGFCVRLPDLALHTLNSKYLTLLYTLRHLQTNLSLDLPVSFKCKRCLR